jgi:HlyD family secretion protein
MDTAARTEVAIAPKRRARWGRVAAIAALVGFAVPGAVRAARGPEVPVVRVARKSIVQKVVANGRVLPPAQVNLGVLLAGVVAEVSVDEGDHVRQGDVLLRLEDDELDASAAQAKAGLAAAKARAYKLAAFDALVASEELGRADAELRKAQADYERAKRLVEQGSLPATQLEDADIAKQRAEKARASAALRRARRARRSTRPRAWSRSRPRGCGSRASSRPRRGRSSRARSSRATSCSPRRCCS